MKLLQMLTNTFFDKNYNQGIATVRAGNVIGGGDWSLDRLVPTVRSFSKNMPQKLEPQIRLGLAVCIGAFYRYMILCQKLWHNPREYSQAWNFGPDISSIKNVRKFLRVKKILGQKEVSIIKENSIFKESKLLHLNSNKAKKNY